MPGEAAYFWDIFWDLTRAWARRKDEQVEALDARRTKLAVRIPRALRQFNVEVSGMEQRTPLDRKAKARRQMQGALAAAIVRQIELDGTVIDVDRLYSHNLFLRSQEKLVLYLEEAFPLLEFLDRCTSTVASDPIIPVLQGNLHLRLMELQDVRTEVRSIDEQLVGGPLNVMIDEFIYHAESVGKLCGLPGTTTNTPLGDHEIVDATPSAFDVEPATTSADKDVPHQQKFCGVM